MERAIEPGPRQVSLRKQRMLISGAILFVLIVPLALLAWQSSRTVGIRALDPASPYANTRLAVEYVGDAACARCHFDIAATFRLHPMGRSLLPIARQPVPPGAPADGPLFESQGLEYSIEQRDGRVWHQETRRDKSGEIVTRSEAEVQFVLGSGRQGISYVVDRDGFLFESPINWYSQKRRWDLSPGFEVANYHFDRPIRPGCLYCHANRVQSVATSINQYRQPIFEGHAIGCERCHGPGELHARDPVVDVRLGPKIVNPADLEPSLRDAVCEQCHLIGDHRVVRASRREEDYRPGLPFERFWTVFVQPASGDESRFVGQVEQMHESQCYIASKGRLGCISCHDPHKLPAPEEKSDYYRSRCLECHAERGCSLPAPARLERSRGDDCTGCHMARANNSDIPHSASADHRIPRTNTAANPSETAANPSAGGLAGPARHKHRPVPFHGAPADAQEKTTLERDLGVALCRSGEDGARIAVPMLRAAVWASPDDVPAREALGLALGRVGRDDEALAAFQKTLNWEPTRESTLVAAAYLTMKLGRRRDAISFWQRAIAINPWRSDYHAELALVYFDDGNWNAAAAASRDALELRPSWVDVRKRLAQCYRHLGEFEAALGEEETIRGFPAGSR
jgi:hypothetical protein